MRIAEPEPLLAVVFPVRVGAVTIDFLVRRWGDGDAARCRRCSTCRACADACLTIVPPSASGKGGGS